ncbi:NUDIX domain-containing protein [Engelhardtia mirabilis]|uniref:8-oxo-dGTP diphosphatase n=1 Tax=Engelhardtia mirabilis TaxID=2528011 RepID=A0A518BF94_9BACT|nr:8-oxo-dGTP diphosphatase [Planctomycetes bacterium Pla133]QDU99979.1 8-oxo-dGTP diphosphatase [Planctomycetes bacterium Pla86]
MTWRLVIDPRPRSEFRDLIDPAGPAVAGWRRVGARLPTHVLLEMVAFELVERRRQVAERGFVERTWRVPLWPSAAIEAAWYDVDRCADLLELLPRGTRVEVVPSSAETVDAAGRAWFGRRLFDAQRYLQALGRLPGEVGAWPPPTHATVGGFLRDGDRVLLERRPDHAKVYPGQWDWPGGHPESSEEPEATLIRELGEELGVAPTAFRLTARIEHTDAASGRAYEHWCFEVTAWSGEVRAREGQRVEWFTIDEALRLPDLGPCVPEALARLGVRTVPGTKPPPSGSR